jgi:hypothetical protein
MANEIDTEQLQQGLMYGAIGFGVVAALVPGVFSGLYGLGQDANLKTMVRLWGTRTAAIGVAGLLVDDEAKRHLVKLSTANNIVDTVLIARSSGVSGRAKVLGVLSTTAFAAGFGYLAAKG